MDTEAIYQALLKYDTLNERIQSIEQIIGQPGVSKSEMIEDFCRNNNVEYVAYKTPYTKEKQMNNRYEIVNGEFTAKHVLDKNPCTDEFDSFVRRFGFYSPITQRDINWMVDNEKNEWLDWLELKGFINSNKMPVVFSKDPASCEGYCISIGLHDPSCLQLYYNGEAIGSAHLVMMRIEPDGSMSFRPCGSVDFDGHSPNIKIENGYTVIRNY